MRMRFFGWLLLAIPLSAFAASTVRVPPTVIRIPGGEHGLGFDDIGYSATLHRITIPAGVTGNLVLLDPETNALTVIHGISGPSANGKQHHREGTSSATFAEGYLFANNHGPAELVAIDPRTRMVLGRTKLSGDSDYVRYVARTHEIWVTEPDQQQIQVFRLAASAKPVLTPETVIHVNGGPESLEIDNRRNRAYSNRWTGQTVEMSLTAHKVLAEWPNTCKRSHGIAIDEIHDHVFVACGAGRIVALAPAEHGKVLADATAGAGIDIISYNPQRHNLYVPGARSATLSVFRVSGSGKLQRIAVYGTAQHAHCVTSDNAGHVFVCDPKGGNILEFQDPELRPTRAK